MNERMNDQRMNKITNSLIEVSMYLVSQLTEVNLHVSSWTTG